MYFTLWALALLAIITSLPLKKNIKKGPWILDKWGWNVTLSYVSTRETFLRDKEPLGELNASPQHRPGPTVNKVLGTLFYSSKTPSSGNSASKVLQLWGWSWTFLINWVLTVFYFSQPVSQSKIVTVEKGSCAVKKKIVWSLLVGGC